MKDYINKFSDKQIKDIRIRLLLDTKLRRDILKRDNYSCSFEGCDVDYSMIHNSELPTNKRIIKANPLQIHHVYSLKENMETELNEDWIYDKKYLITLCTKCHKNHVTGHSKDYIDYFLKLIEERS